MLVAGIDLHITLHHLGDSCRAVHIVHSMGAGGGED